MLLNLKEALETVKRAGFGNDDTINTDNPQRRMVDGEFLQSQEGLDEVLAQIDFHRNPQNMTLDQLFDVEDL